MTSTQLHTSSTVFTAQLDW